MSIDKYKKDIDALLTCGRALEVAMCVEQYPESKEKFDKEALKKFPKFSEKYQQWYSEALVCLQQLLPSRVDDFVHYYKSAKQRKEITAENYSVSDYLQGISASRGVLVVVEPSAAIPKFQQQLKIVEALKNRFESSLYDIKALLQADLFDHEIDASAELVKNGYLRAAGALAGVVLESHLQVVCVQHNITLKKIPHLSDLNQALKDGNVIETSVWRNIQFLGDIRNICDHKKTKDPLKEQINDLIDGVKKIIKTVF